MIFHFENHVHHNIYVCISLSSNLSSNDIVWLTISLLIIWTNENNQIFFFSSNRDHGSLKKQTKNVTNISYRWSLKKQQQQNNIEVIKYTVNILVHFEKAHIISCNVKIEIHA